MAGDKYLIPILISGLPPHLNVVVFDIPHC